LKKKKEEKKQTYVFWFRDNCKKDNMLKNDIKPTYQKKKVDEQDLFNNNKKQTV